MNMNFGQEPKDEPSNSLFVSFNQDASTLVIVTKTGYKLYALTSTNKLNLLHQEDCENIRIVEHLCSSSLLAIVSLSRRFKLLHFRKKKDICNNTYTDTILAVKMNRTRLIVCLEHFIHIHYIVDMELLHTIKDTPPNPKGLCALSYNSNNSYLAYPANNMSGEVNVYDTHNLQSKVMIAAHDKPLTAIAFDTNGLKIATASEKGTVIRVFNVLDGQNLHELRRGYTRSVYIFSLAFSSDSHFLCASSNKETVHIFKLKDLTEGPSEEPQSLLGHFSSFSRRALAQTSSFLSSVADMMNNWPSFATATLPSYGSPNICSVVNIKKFPRVLIASSDGNLYIYNLNITKGGICTLVKQHRLDVTLSSGAEASNLANIQVLTPPKPKPQFGANYDQPLPSVSYSGF